MMIPQVCLTTDTVMLSLIHSRLDIYLLRPIGGLRHSLTPWGCWAPGNKFHRM